MTDKGTEECKHFGSLGLDIGGARLGWCPHCGAFMGPLQIVRAFAETMAKSNPLSPKPPVIPSGEGFGFIRPYGRKAPHIFGAKKEVIRG